MHLPGERDSPFTWWKDLWIGGGVRNTVLDHLIPPLSSEAFIDSSLHPTPICSHCLLFCPPSCSHARALFFQAPSSPIVLKTVHLLAWALFWIPDIFKSFPWYIHWISYGYLTLNLQTLIWLDCEPLWQVAFYLVQIGGQDPILCFYLLASRTLKPSFGRGLIFCPSCCLRGEEICTWLWREKDGRNISSPLCDWWNWKEELDMLSYFWIPRLPKFSRLSMFWFVCISTCMINIKGLNLRFIDIDLDYDISYWWFKSQCTLRLF